MQGDTRQYANTLFVISLRTNLERQRRIFVEPNRAGNRVRVRSADGAEVGGILGKVDERGVRDGLGTTGVGDVDELVEELGVLGVVPVAEDDGELLVVGVGLRLRVDDDGGAQTVDVLALWVVSAR